MEWFHLLPSSHAGRPHGTTVDEIAVSFSVVGPLGAPAVLPPTVHVCQEPSIELQQLIRLSGLTNPCLLTWCYCSFTGTRGRACTRSSARKGKR